MRLARLNTLRSMNWDPDLNEVAVDASNMVTGVKCDLMLVEDIVDLKPGDVYYRLISAIFIDEYGAQGRHNVTVDVIGPDGRRLDGATVTLGWPTHRWPETDDKDNRTVFGANMAEFSLYAEYDAWKVIGPYWTCVKDGPSDVFLGMGLPWKHHVCYSVVFQKMVWGDAGGQPPVPPEPGSITEALARIEAGVKDTNDTLTRVFR